jgi:hypothetical protein
MPRLTAGHQYSIPFRARTVLRAFCCTFVGGGLGALVDCKSALVDGRRKVIALIRLRTSL